MGGDGGVIATERKFLRGTKSDEKDESKNIKKNQITRAQICAHSGSKLRHPIVVCEMGNLYNKEAIITALLNKTLNPSFSHIRGLKDIKELIFSRNTDYEESKETNGEFQSKFMCPITLMEFNGLTPFVVIWTTGYVISEKAIREMGIDALQAEYGPFANIDIIKLLPIEEEIPQQVSLLQERRMRKKKDTKDSKKRASENLSKTHSIATDTTGAMCDSSIDNSSDMHPHSSSSAVMTDTTQHTTSHLMSSTNTLTCSSQTSKKRKTTNNASTSDVADDVHANASRNHGQVQGQGQGTGIGGLSKAAVTAQSVNEAVKKREEESSVFKSLFHKGSSADKHDRDLFMSVAGLRYTIS